MATTSNARRSSDRTSITSPRRVIIIVQEPSPERCPKCHNMVVPDLEFKKDNCTNIAALILCLFCMWPCAVCVFCCPCNVYSYYRCPVCGNIIRTEQIP